jgi:hypothetical protein
VTASARVRDEWRARIAAEYGSAAIAQHLVLWLIQAAAPPELIDAGLAIVADELAHSRLSFEVFYAAGGTAPPALDRNTLCLARTEPVLERDILRTAVRVFCLGETVAVPLFSHLRARCTEPVARAALDRILRDEVRHREFGWDLLDWLCDLLPEAPQLVAPQLPQMLAELDVVYGCSDDADLADADAAWGLAAPRAYKEILARTIERDFAPRFAAREILLARPPDH